jgi:hypothetical protein
MFAEAFTFVWPPELADVPGAAPVRVFEPAVPVCCVPAFPVGAVEPAEFGALPVLALGLELGAGAFGAAVLFCSFVCLDVLSALDFAGSDCPREFVEALGSEAAFVFSPEVVEGLDSPVLCPGLCSAGLPSAGLFVSLVWDWFGFCSLGLLSVARAPVGFDSFAFVSPAERGSVEECAGAVRSAEGERSFGDSAPPCAADLGSAAREGLACDFSAGADLSAPDPVGERSWAGANAPERERARIAAVLINFARMANLQYRSAALTRRWGRCSIPGALICTCVRRFTFVKAFGAGTRFPAVHCI